MTNQLIPPPEMAPPVPERLTPTQRIETWMEWIDACEQFLLAGLRHAVGKEGDLKSAYRQWYEEQMTEHDRTMNHLVEQFNRRSDRGR